MWALASDMRNLADNIARLQCCLQWTTQQNCSCCRSWANQGVIRLARLSAVVSALLSLDKAYSPLAVQPCNPAVGGPAKSQLVHEVDAMNGEMGKMADRCYLQKRVLNRSKVFAPSSRL